MNIQIHETCPYHIINICFMYQDIPCHKNKLLIK